MYCVLSSNYFTHYLVYANRFPKKKKKRIIYSTLRLSNIKMAMLRSYLGVIKWCTMGYMIAFSLPGKSTVYTLAWDINSQAMINIHRKWVKMFELKNTLDTLWKLSDHGNNSNAAESTIAYRPGGKGFHFTPRQNLIVPRSRGLTHPKLSTRKKVTCLKNIGNCLCRYILHSVLFIYNIFYFSVVENSRFSFSILLIEIYFLIKCLIYN